MTDVKFCGLTRPGDAIRAVSSGAAYLGFVFAPSPRRLTVDSARELVRAVEAGRGFAHLVPGVREEPSPGGPPGVRPEGAPRRVGVFAGMRADDIARAVDVVGLDVVQLHDEDGGTRLRELRGTSPAAVWIVAHVGSEGLSPESLEAAADADGLLLDTRVDGALGGTGRSFDWERAGEALAPIRGRTPIILAGGLHPGNVGLAVRTLAPDAVDVSSGVESRPGIKDHGRMQAFIEAVRGAESG